MKRIAQFCYDTGMKLAAGERLTLTYEGKTGWSEILHYTATEDIQLTTVSIYALEATDMAGTYPGLIIIVGEQKDRADNNYDSQHAV